MMALDDPDLEPLWASLATDKHEVIEVRPSQEFKGAWVAFEAPGVDRRFRTLTKQKAIDYARTASAGVAARFTFTATTLQPSSAASSSTVAASILKPPASKRSSAAVKSGSRFRFSGLRDYV